MRKSHIEYIRSVFKTIDPDLGFLEIHPAVDSVVRVMPCVAVSDVKTTRRMPDGKRTAYAKLGSTPPAPIKDRTLHRYGVEEYRYRLHYYTANPEGEVLSGADELSVVDRCVVHIAKHSLYVNDFNARCHVRLGDSGLDTSLADEGIYCAWFEVIFEDMMFAVDEVNVTPVSQIGIRSVKLSD